MESVPYLLELPRALRQSLRLESGASWLDAKSRVGSARLFAHPFSKAVRHEEHEGGLCDNIYRKAAVFRNHGKTMKNSKDDE